MKDKSQDLLCGIGSWRPKCIQWMAKPSVFLVMMSISSLVQGGSYVYFVASMTTLEKRYSFSSKISGFILIADNIPEMTLGPLVGYLANRIHRPRLLGCGYVLVGLGLYLAALPYFIYGPATRLLTLDPNNLGKYTINRTVEFCDQSNDVKNSCDENSGSTGGTTVFAVVLIWIACFLNGFGSSFYFSVGIPFVDDSVKKKNTPLFISTTSAFRVLGPTIGFMLSSLCLTYYEDPTIDPGIKDRSDPRWVGAWWIGFIVLGTFIIFTALPLFLFPAQLNKELKHKQSLQKTKGLLFIKQKEEEKAPSARIRFMRLIKNPIYMCYVFGTLTRLFAVLGYWTFKSKYIESDYKKSASAANLFSGIIGVVPTATGIFLGGFIIQCFRPGPRVLTSFITIVEILALTGMTSALFLGCPTPEFAGKQTDHFEIQKMCNADCFCSQKTFQPICESNGRTNYFSPCFAGCSNTSLIRHSDMPNEYSDCKCGGHSFKEGYCETDCGNNFAIYVTLLGISNIVGHLAKTGNAIISLRIVDPIDKSFAIGLAEAILCIFALIPYPLVYGAVTDSTCLIWEETCGRKGNCWVYDIPKFRKYLHGLTIGLYLIGSVFDVIVIFLSGRIKNLYDDGEDEHLDNNKLNSKNHHQIELEAETELL